MNASRISRTAPTLCPVTTPVSIEAAACEIAHPRPSKVTLARRPSLIRTQIRTVSPQKRLWALPLVDGAPSAPRLRGRRK